MSFKLGIVGSRNFSNYKLVCDTIGSTPVSHIVSGGAKGADSMGVRYAQAHCIPYSVYPANWSKHGKKAGYMRNRQIVENCDIVIAFWDGKSKGTKLTIDICKELHVPCKIINFSLFNDPVNWDLEQEMIDELKGD
jgi:hypothetical protein